MIRVFYGPPTSEDQLLHPSQQQNASLTVPPLDKNFLISPPGSPPVGWEQIKEDPPNTETLAGDLMQALQNLALGQSKDSRNSSREETPLVGSPTTPEPSSPVARQPDTLIIPSPEDHSFPAVLVSDTTDSFEPTASGVTLLNTPHGIPRSSTPRPDISQVKATVESMQEPSRITPTARPPLT